MAVTETIGEWTPTQLVKFLQESLTSNPPTFSPNLKVEEFEVVRKAQIMDEIQFFQSTTSVGAAGGAAALPATPVGYIKILDYRGLVKLIPYYNT